MATKLRKDDGTFIDADDISAGEGYKTYRAIVTQTGTSAPVATVLKNTFSGPITWSRVSAGSYKAVATEGFSSPSAKKVFVNVIYDYPNSDVYYLTSGHQGGTPHFIQVLTSTADPTFGTTNDGFKAYVEIYMYE